VYYGIVATFRTERDLIMSQLPPVAFPGPLPAAPLTYGGKTYTFANGYLTQANYDCVNGVATFRWRLYDYPNAHLISDQEAQLLEVNPETLVVVPNIWTRAAADVFVAGVVAGNLGAALIANLWPALDAANTALLAAEQDVAADQTQLAAANAQLATDEAASPQVPETITADQALVAKWTAQLQVDQAAVIAAQGQIASAQASITATEAQF
jgi:hypothetical protein